MTEVARRSQHNVTGLSNGQVGNAAGSQRVAGVHFRRQLQGTAKKVTNDIGMRHNDFHWWVVVRRRSVKVCAKGLFNPRMLLIHGLNLNVLYLPAWNVVTRAVKEYIVSGWWMVSVSECW